MKQVYEKSKRASRLDILDALRGLAALSVAFFHFTNAMNPTIFQQIANLGWLGVEVFFVITGFIIPYSLGRVDLFYYVDHQQTRDIVGLQCN